MSTRPRHRRDFSSISGRRYAATRFTLKSGHSAGWATCPLGLSRARSPFSQPSERGNCNGRDDACGVSSLAFAVLHRRTSVSVSLTRTGAKWPGRWLGPHQNCRDRVIAAERGVQRLQTQERPCRSVECPFEGGRHAFTVESRTGNFGAIRRRPRTRGRSWRICATRAFQKPMFPDPMRAAWMIQSGQGQMRLNLSLRSCSM
jgi:hypothetical protein